VLSVRKALQPALQPAAESKESEAQVEAEGDASKGRHRSEMASKPRRPQQAAMEQAEPKKAKLMSTHGQRKEQPTKYNRPKEDHATRIQGQPYKLLRAPPRKKSRTGGDTWTHGIGGIALSLRKPRFSSAI